MKISKYILGYGLISFFIAGCNVSGNEDLPACACEDESFIEATAIVSPSSPTGSISNYDHDGDFTADAACHATMFIYFEWADSTRASTTEVPPIVPSFETPLGYFPSSNLQTKETVVSVDENTVVYHYSYFFFTDEAQDKDHPEATSYGVRWTYGNSTAPAGNVKVRATLLNRIYDEDEYSRADLKECAN